MKIALLIISILLIIIVLLQSGKAEGAAKILSGGNSDLFTKRKERGTEKALTRIRYYIFYNLFSSFFLRPFGLFLLIIFFLVFL